MAVDTEKTGSDHAWWADEVVSTYTRKGGFQNLGGYGEEELVDDAEILMAEFCLLDDDLRGPQ